MRRRIFRLYGELKFLEADCSAATAQERAVIVERLDNLEERANRMRVPIAFAHMLYTLKLHISLVRQHVKNEPDQTSANLPSSQTAS